MFTSPQGVANKLPHSVKGAALAASLVLSALLTAVALQSPDDRWLAWFSFLPLFVAVRSLRPATAALAGGMWGAALYVFFTAGPTPAIGPSGWLLALLIVIPGVYVGLAARPARAIGFKLLTLALGWTLIEVVVALHNPSGPHDSLLIGSQTEGPHLHWLARLLGYVCTAFLVACASASLVGMLSGAHLSVPAYRSSVGSPTVVGQLASPEVLPIQSWTPHQANPRAPPA